MHARRFGSAGPEVPVFGIGTWNMEHDDRGAAIAAIRRALDLGMVHVDTAELYGSGKVERMVGEAIAGRRDQVFLVSKVVPRHATHAGTIQACEASLARLGTDHLDAYLLHWREELPLAETFRAFDDLVRQGKIRRWGVSNFDDADLAEALALVGPRRADSQLVCNQVLYHLGERAIEHRIVPWCEQRGIAVVAYSPLGSRGGFPDSRALDPTGGSAPRPAGRAVGVPTPRLASLDGVARRLDATPRQVALAFLARRPSTLVIPKSSQARHVDELAGADRVALDPAAITAIEAAFPLRPWRGLPTL
ncbi:MAG TPA: aldo/keto reductase [Kofleriaceae bacterium]|nr:aldo/keto reductase [Kofleriaceae bacterium]